MADTQSQGCLETFLTWTLRAENLLTLVEISSSLPHIQPWPTYRGPGTEEEAADQGAWIKLPECMKALVSRVSAQHPGPVPALCDYLGTLC